MIIRAKPKYLDFENVNLDKIDIGQEIDTLYFNRGRSALLFLLSNIKRDNKLFKPTIIMQSFNCKVVIEAAHRAGWYVDLLDISYKGDFSISINDLREVEDKPNALLLTHYQGIPNTDYKEIAKYCQNNDILLIEDMAQTYMSSIDNKVVGSLCDFAIESYAFDKPLSCGGGGGLKINNSNYKNLLLSAYGKIGKECVYKCTSDINWLKYKINIIKSCNSIETWNLQTKSKLLFVIGIDYEKIKGSSSKYFLLKILTFLGKVERFTDNYWSYIPKKMCEKKKDLLKKQKLCYKHDKKEEEALERILKFWGYKNILNNFTEMDIQWNRYSILDESGKLGKMLLNRSVEAGNHNWPTPLHKMYKHDTKTRQISKTYINSETAADFIVNIPIWSTYFQEHENEFKKR
ncbi:DegT/DnrJ/EryC1/StrS family aminotransferase [Patescibacteria group bacterium]